MSQVFKGDGKVVPVTLIKVGKMAKEAELRAETPIIIRGFSKGKGYTGVVKRYGFRGGPATHGQSDRHRAPGSIGNRTTPGRVYKGKRMSGRSGGSRITVRGSKIVDFDKDSMVAKVSGPVPGARNGNVVIEILKK